MKSLNESLINESKRKGLIRSRHLYSNNDYSFVNSRHFDALINACDKNKIDFGYGFFIQELMKQGINTKQIDDMVYKSFRDKFQSLLSNCEDTEDIIQNALVEINPNRRYNNRRY